MHPQRSKNDSYWSTCTRAVRRRPFVYLLCHSIYCNRSRNSSTGTTYKYRTVRLNDRLLVPILRSLLFRLYSATIHIRLVNSIRRIVTVVRESYPTQKLQRSNSCRSFHKRPFSRPTVDLVCSLSRRTPSQTCTLQTCTVSFVFLSVPQKHSSNEVDHSLVINEFLTICQQL